MTTTLATLTLAGLFGINPGEFITLFIPLAGIALAGVITVSSLYFQHKRRELWHETARIALEKGQPLPAIPGDDADKHGPLGTRGDRPRERGDLRPGLILIGVGVGLFLFFQGIHGPLAYVAAIPGFIGVALLLNGLIELFTRPKTPPSDTPRL